MRELFVYHGTDLDAARAIAAGTFKCRHSDEHWLGNGIYFYPDRSLAEWWTTQPTKKFGTAVNHPALLRCRLELDEDDVLDLTELAGYKRYIDEFNTFFGGMIEDPPLTAVLNFKKLRALFFNYIFMSGAAKAVIAPFFEPSQPYLPHYDNEEYGREMHIMFTEVQLCVSESEQERVIREKSVIELGGNENGKTPQGF